MRQVSITQEAILFELADFQYLTNSQLERLLSRSKSAVSRNMTALVNTFSPLVMRVDYLNNGKWGRNESIYYLSERGVKALEGRGLERECIKYPKRKVLAFNSDYFHRVRTVDFFVSLKLWVHSRAYELESFTYYFQQNSGSNRNNRGGQHLSDNKIDVEKDGVGYVVPDGIFMVRRGEQIPIFGLFEQHNGRDTGKLLRQIHAHCVAITHGLPSIAYEAKHEGEYIANRVFVSFEHEACMKATMYRLARDEAFQPLKPLFVFKLSEDVKASSFHEGWAFADGQQANFMQA